MKYDHEVIRDLMPLCVDGIASEKSEAIVKEHIAECEACAAEWAQMQHGEPEQSAVAVPEDETRFQKTARRVRRRKRVAVFITVISVMLASYGLFILVNIPTIHFTMKGLAKASVQDCVRDFYETPEQYAKSKPPETIYLGTVNSNDGKAAAAFSIAKVDNLDYPAFNVSTAERPIPLMFGMWNTVSGQFGMPVMESRVSTVFDISAYQNGKKRLWTVGFYSSDPAVQCIRVTANGKEETLMVNDKHFAGFQIANTENDSNEKALNEILTKGEALDQNGNVLYRLQAVESNVAEGTSNYKIEWVKAQ